MTSDEWVFLAGCVGFLMGRPLTLLIFWLWDWRQRRQWYRAMHEGKLK